jgi:hypothetical protein
MFGQERDDMLELWEVDGSRRQVIYHLRPINRKRTAILRSSIELICLNASMAAPYPHTIRERMTGRCDGGTHECGGLVERSDTLLELRDEAFAGIEPKHIDDVAVTWVRTEA